MKLAATAAIALSLLAASAAMADSRHGRRDHAAEQRYSQDWRDRDRSYDSDRGYDNRYRHYRHRPHHRFHVGEYRRPFGYRHHHWYRGERLPFAYHARPYVLYNYRGCGLRAPPRGHHWVRVNSDAILVAVATGIVLDAVYDRFY